MTISAKHKLQLYVIFAASGFSSLAYEILWTKYLSLTFGNTMVAVSVVAATFMAGLALGSLLLGRYVDQKANLLKVYALLELGIAITALLFDPALKVVGQLYIYWTHQLPELPWLVTSINILFSSLLLLPPTFCMGGTFPLMCRFYARRKSGAQIGRLYALNTLGATFGAFAAGFWLIPTIGLSRTGAVAIGCNLSIAMFALLLAKRYGAVDADGMQQATTIPPQLQAIKHRPILLAIALIGFFGLAYEILWTRLLLLFIGNTSYAFSLMLSAYLVGIALGGALYARLAFSGMNEKKLFLTLSALMGLAILASAPYYDKLAYVFQFAYELAEESWWQLSLLSFLVVFAVTAVPTILSGALLPAAVAIVNPGKLQTGKGVGLIVLHNTLGAVLGSLVAGFILLPGLGLLESFRYLAIGNLALVLVLTLYDRKNTAGYRIPLLLAVGVVLILLPGSWNMELINSGIYAYAPKYAKMGGIDKVLGKEKILEMIEGRDCTVAVHESLDGAFRFFSVNGKTDGGTGSDMSTQVLIGQLPLLLHPKPDDVLVVGLGTGITLKGMSDHPTQAITCVEISPEVVKVEPYFAHANGEVLKDPKVTLVINDGRNLLLTDPQLYDVIVSEPSNPWQTGNSNLFTDDFYILAASRLKDQGIFCQWIGLYDITLENLKIATHTFLNTFPKVLVFQSGPDLIMVGANYSLAFDYQQLRNRFAVPGINNTLDAIGIDTPGDLIAAGYLFADDTLRNFSKEADCLNTDDRPILEFSARYNLGEQTLGEYANQNLKALMNARSGKVYLPIRNFGKSPEKISDALKQIGQGYARIGRNVDAANFMRKAEEVF